jgi:protein phosphatase
MGTTCTTMVLIPEGVLVAHIGDSRCYRLRGNVFEQLTFDHSMVWEMWAAGSMTPEQVQQYVPKNIITRAMGRDWNVQVDMEGPLPVQVGDTYLLCTDGLSGQITDKELGALLACLPPQKAARLLVDLGNLRGGPDNITLIVARVLGPQIARGGAVDSPPSRVERSAARPIHPFSWIALGLFASLTLAMSLANYWAAAIIGLVGTAISALVAVWQRNRAAEKPTVTAPSGPLGRGPYVRCDAVADRELVERLAGTVQELRDAAVQGNWVVDWATFNSLQGRGAAALGRNEMPQAVCEYSEAICFMMGQLRQQNNRKPGQDSVLG